MSKLLFLQGALYTGIATLTPWVTYLAATDNPITWRSLACCSVGSIVAGATALKAFLSTTFSDSPASDPEKQKD